jgi:hypothetical protein
MALKYCDPSLSTGLNDGTSLANAWQSFVEVFTNTMGSGSITGGDTIYVRTYDGAANTTEALSADTTCAIPAVETAATSVIFDDGTIWAADAGVFILDLTASTYEITFVHGVDFIADGTNQRFRIDTQYDGGSVKTQVKLKNAYYEGLYVYQDAAYGGAVKVAMGDNSSPFTFTVLMKDCRIKLNKIFSSGHNLLLPGNYIGCIYINLIFDFTDLADTGTKYVVDPSQYGGSQQYIGCSIVGGFEGLYMYQNFNNALGEVTFSGFETGGSSKIYEPGYQSFTDAGNSLKVIGTNVDGWDSVYMSGGVQVDWTSGENYPYYNAILPDTASTPWSFRVFPVNTTPAKLAMMPQIEKFYNGTAATKTFTIELLINDAFTDATQSTIYAEFQYVDNTLGTLKQQTTRVKDGALTTSVVGWSNTTYGSQTYLKRSIAVTTATTVKPGTIVRATLFCGVTKISIDDFFFYDPDINIS